VDLITNGVSCLCNIKKGQQLSRINLSNTDKYPVINGGMEPSGYTNNYNTNKNTITIREGGNSCGYVNYIDTNFWSGGHCYTLSNLVIDDKFLFQYLKLFEVNIRRLRVGSGLPNIQKRDLTKFNIKYPLKKEQEKFAQIPTLADKEITKLQVELVF